MADAGKKFRNVLCQSITVLNKPKIEGDEDEHAVHIPCGTEGTRGRIGRLKTMEAI